MPAKDFLDHSNMEIDEDLEIIEEIPLLSSSKKKAKFNQITPSKPSAKEELKQANNKIAQQKDTILELQQKLNYQNGKLQESTQIIANQKMLLLTAQKEKLKLRRAIALEKRRGKEKLSKLLDFFKHINNEFSFAVDVLNGKQASNLNVSKFTPAKTGIKVERQLKNLSTELKNKLEKLKNMEMKKTQELDDVKKMLADVPVQKLPCTTSTSAQTNVTSVEINNYLTESNQPLSPNAKEGPLRLRLKRSFNDCREIGNGSVFESPPISPSEYLQEIKYTKDKLANKKSQMLAMGNNYYSSETKHELDTTKPNVNLFYCTCGLTFASEKWLGYHTNLFLTFYSGDDKESSQGLPYNFCNSRSNQTSVIVNNMQKK